MKMQISKKEKGGVKTRVKGKFLLNGSKKACFVGRFFLPP